MSGLSKEGGFPVFNGPEESDSCENLKIITLLSSPKAEILEHLKVGDVLSISVLSDQGPIVANYNGQIAGSISSKEQIRLLNCINAGTDYKANVLSIDGAMCRVQIGAK